mgnify:CR=1 FL=1
MNERPGIAVSHLLTRLRHPDVRGLLPAYFGMVMATGIVSLAVNQIGLRPLALVLFAVAWITYVILWWLMILRLIRHPRRLFADVTDHMRGPGAFTVVAATALLGNGSVILTGWTALGFALWLVAGLLWLVLTYTIFTALTVKEVKPTLNHGINGAWLLAVVATQSIAVLATLLSPELPQKLQIIMGFVAVSMWLWGGMLYIWMMTLIFYRYNFFHFSPGDLSPPYWINMGAMAISTLAGSLLISDAPEAAFLASILPFLKGMTILFWASGTWWIPMLLVLGVWRHIYKRFPLRYDPLYWGAIFPLGMYAVATDRMSLALGLGFLAPLASGFVLAAIGAWLLAFGALVVELMRRPLPDPA